MVGVFWMAYGYGTYPLQVASVHTRTVTAAMRAQETSRFKKNAIPARPQNKKLQIRKISTKAGTQTRNRKSRLHPYFTFLFLAGALCTGFVCTDQATKKLLPCPTTTPRGSLPYRVCTGQATKRRQDKRVKLETNCET